MPHMVAIGRAWPLEQQRSFARLVEDLAARLRTARARRVAAAELAAMSDRELADMSISSSDRGRLFDPDFALDHRPRGASGRARPGWM